MTRWFRNVGLYTMHRDKIYSVQGEGMVGDTFWSHAYVGGPIQETLVFNSGLRSCLQGHWWEEIFDPDLSMDEGL